MDFLIDSVQYATVSGAQHAEALAMLVSRDPASERAGGIAAITTALRREGVSTATLVGAKRAATLTAAAWAQILPGKTALIWPPRLEVNESETVGDQLQKFLDSQLEAAGIRMAQAVLPDRENLDAQRLLRVGYTHAADLLYLVNMLGQGRAEVATAEFNIDFEQYTQAERNRLSELIERTYVDTLDVPALDGMREMDDVLNGYEQTGIFSPERWFFIRHGDEDVGCLLLNDHPERQQWELVYMGIVPEARGNGWGGQAARFAQQLAIDAGREGLILAVDVSNEPAVDAYTRAGFFEVSRRSVFLKVFTP